jgi:hypothetical protein
LPEPSQKTKDEAATLDMYKAQSGRRRVINSIVGQLRKSIAGPFESATAIVLAGRNGSWDRVEYL